jgi:hypothetical protein
VAPDLAVVRDLDQIVDLGALPDHGVAHEAAVDGRVGADLHIVLDDHARHLRHLAVPLRARQIAEAVLADAGARMDDHAVPDQRMHDGCAGPDGAIAPDPHLWPDHRASCDHATGSDFGARPDHRSRVDRHALLEPRRRVHQRALRHATRLEQGGRAHGAGIELLGDRHEGAVRRRRHEHGDAVGGARREALGGEADAGPRRRIGAGIFRVLQEGEIARGRAIERRYAADAAVRRHARPHHGAGERGDLLRGQPLRALEEQRLAHATHCGA